MSRLAVFLAAGLALLGAFFSGLLPVPSFQEAAAKAPGTFTEKKRSDLTPSLPTSGDYQPPAFESAKHQFDFSGSTRTYYSTGPKAGSSPRAAIVLLHGSGRDGRAMLDMWKGVGQSENVVLIAPDASDSGGWSSWSDGSDFLDAVVADAGKIHAIDPARLYLFGHSSGAEHALAMAHDAKAPWRAVAVHAGAFDTGGSASAHPVPVYIYVGDQDDIFKLDATRAAAQTFAASGHNVTFTVIPNHTHWYYVIGPALARDAWKKMKSG